jgi:hypothetical protein
MSTASVISAAATAVASDLTDIENQLTIVENAVAADAIGARQPGVLSAFVGPLTANNLTRMGLIKLRVDKLT